MSTTGNSTYTKSMNGIITFDDGSGTVIEDGSVVTDNFSTVNFATTNLSADNITTDSIQPISDTNIYLFTDILAGRTLYVGDSCTTSIGGGSLVVDSATVKTENISSSLTTDAVSLYTATTGNITLGGSGKIELGQYLSVTNKTIASLFSSDSINLFDNITTGTVNMCKFDFKQNSIASGAISDSLTLFGNITTGNANFFNNLSSGYVNMCNTFAMKPNNIEYNNATTSFNLFSNIADACSINFGGVGTVNICDSIQASLNKINVINPASNFYLLDNLTESLHIANGQTTAGIITIGQNKTAGYVLLGSASASTIIKGNASCEKNIDLGNATSTQIYSTNAAAPFTIRGDNTLTVYGSGTSKYGSWNGGQVELGTDSNSNIIIGAGGSNGDARTTTIKGNTINIGNSAGTGTNTFIGNTKTGTAGTTFRCIISGTIGAGLSGVQTYTIPGAPTGFGTPIVMTTINVNSGNSTNIYCCNSNPISTTQFTYRKRRDNGTALADASSESISYVAYWL